MRRITGVVAGVLVLAVLASVFAAADQDVECTITLQPGDSIQEAIDNADGADVICLAPGVYEEILTISRDIKIRGTGETPGEVQIKGTSRTKPGVSIASSEGNEEPFIAAFENLTLLNRYPAKFHGVELGGVAGLKLTGVAVLGSMRYALILRDSTTAEISNSTIGDSEYGIKAADSCTLIVSDTTFSDIDEMAFEVTSSASATLERCDFSGGEFAAGGSAVVVVVDSILDRSTTSIGGSAQASFEACSFSYGSGGVVTAISSAQLRLTHCTISHNSPETPARISGLVVAGPATAVVEGCEFSDNGGTALHLQANAALVIKDSVIVRNTDFGIFAYLKDCWYLIVADSTVDKYYSPGEEFHGRISGSGNTIPGPGEPDGNGLGDVCPNSFSTVKE